MTKVVKYFIVILFLFVLLSFIFGILGVGNFSIEKATQGKLVSIMDQEIRVLEKGVGPDVLLIHGTPGSIEDMFPLIDSLAKNHHVIAYDRPGHGYSSANDIPRNLAHNTKMAHAIIEHYELEDALVIGHSYGGIVAMNMAVQGNEKAKHMIVMGSPLFTFNSEPIYNLFDIPILRTCLSWLVSGWYSGSKIEKELPTRFAYGKKPSEEYVAQRKKLWSQPKVILSKSLETVQIGAELEEIKPKYKALKNKVHIIVGEDEKPVYITDLKANLPLANVTETYYPNTAHFIQSEALDLLLAEIRFLYSNAMHASKSMNGVKSEEMLSILEAADVEGAILIYDEAKNTYYANDFDKASEKHLPASTYKIPNTIIGLETGILEDENTVFKYDGSPRPMKIWEEDLKLSQAFQRSCVPCYQELAINIGGNRMREYLSKLDFGKMDVQDSNIDSFWLVGNSQISPFQQIDFLSRLYHHALPISDDTYGTLKQIMKIKELGSSMVYGKTGLAITGPKDKGWFVGYVERQSGPIYFASMITPKAKKMDRGELMQKRKSLTYKALEVLNFLD